MPLRARALVPRTEPRRSRASALGGFDPYRGRPAGLAPVRGPPGCAVDAGPPQAGARHNGDLSRHVNRADEPLQGLGLGQGLVAGNGVLPELALRERRGAFGEHLEDAPFGWFGWRIGLVRVDLAQTQCGPLAMGDELDLDVIEVPRPTPADSRSSRPSNSRCQAVKLDSCMGSGLQWKCNCCHAR